MRLDLEYGYKPKEDQFIIEKNKKMSYPEMGSCIGRSADSIRQRIEILKRLGKLERSGFVQNGIFHPLYSEEDNKLISELYPSQPIEFLMGKLNRSEASIRNQAFKLKVKKGPPPYLNVRRVCKLLRVTRHIVINWINQGFLKASHNGRRAGPYYEWRIEFQDFYNFVENYYFLYETERVRDKFLCSIIESTPAGKAVSVRQAAKLLDVSESKIKRLINKGKLRAYKHFGGQRGFRGFRWFVILSESDFEWFIHSMLILM